MLQFQKHLFRRFFVTNDVMCRALWHHLSSLPHQFLIFEDVGGWKPWKREITVNLKLCKTPVPKFETYQKRFWDLEIGPKFSETRVFQGAILYPITGMGMENRGWGRIRCDQNKIICCLTRVNLFSISCRVVKLLSELVLLQITFHSMNCPNFQRCVSFTQWEI